METILLCVFIIIQSSFAQLHNNLIDSIYPHQNSAYFQSDKSVKIFFAQVINSSVLQMMIFHNYPNELNPSTTTIQYAVGNRQFVQHKVYDIRGNELLALIDEYKPAGVYNVEFRMQN